VAPVLDYLVTSEKWIVSVYIDGLMEVSGIHSADNMQVQSFDLTASHLFVENNDVLDQNVDSPGTIGKIIRQLG